MQRFSIEKVNFTSVSSDELKTLSEQDWQIALIRSSKNLGYSGGNNAAIKFALTHGHFPYTLLLNNDTVLHPNAIRELLKHADANPSHGIIGSTILYYDNPDLVECTAGCTYNPLTTILTNRNNGAVLATVLQGDNTVELDYIHGAASFFRTEVFHKYGYLDEQFFLYYEELDFAQRLVNSFYKLAWCRDSFIYHKGVGSVTPRKKSELAEQVFLRSYHENMSTLLYSKKHCKGYYLLPAALRFVGKAVKLLFSKNPYLLPALFQAYIDFFIRNRNTATNTNESSQPKLVFIGLIKH